MKKNNILGLLRAEIETFHDFISAWFRGEIGQSELNFREQFADRLAPTFVNIQPSGQMLDRAGLLASIRDGFGTNPEFEIEITDVALRCAHSELRLALATYIEHQRRAKNSTPSNNTRISSVLFEMPSAGGRPTWLHIHETAKSLSFV